MSFVIRGRVWKFGDNLQGDYHLLPYPQVREIFDAKELAKYCMINVDPEFPAKVREGDVIVAGDNFGCNICHPHALMALKGAGIALVVAASLASENIMVSALHEGLPMMECPGVGDAFANGDELEADLETGNVKNLSTGLEITTEPVPKVILERLREGGLIPYIRNLISSSASDRHADPE